MHLREDRRHIQDRDVRLIRQAMRTRLNLEMADVPEIVAIAEEVRPMKCASCRRSDRRSPPRVD